MNSITIRFFSPRLERRVETETLPPFGHRGGGFTVDYPQRVYKGGTLRRDQRFRVRDGVASGNGH